MGNEYKTGPKKAADKIVDAEYEKAVDNMAKVMVEAIDEHLASLPPDKAEECERKGDEAIRQLAVKRRNVTGEAPSSEGSK